MKSLSVGDTLEILKEYSIIFVKGSGLSNYDINSSDYLNLYNFLADNDLLPIDRKSNVILPEVKTYMYLFHQDVYFKMNGLINPSSIDLNSNSMVRLAHCLWNWNNSKLIYRFDRDIEKDLIDNSDFSFNSQMPVELFDYLPHDNFFVSTVELNNQDQLREIIINKSKQSFDFLSRGILSENESLNKLLEEVQVLGFFFAKDKLYRLDESNKIIGYDIHYRITLMFHLNMDGDFFCPKVQIDLNIPKNRDKPLTIQNCISYDKDDRECELFITKVLPYIFYLCSENSVIQERKLSKKQLKKLYKDKSEIKPIIKVVSKPVEEDKVLYRTFSPVSIIEIKEDDSSGKKKSTPKSPHERRSHWHRYWIGKKDSNERRMILKWISSMKIRADLGKVLNTEIRVKR